MNITQRELNALEIAGFDSVTEILDRYFQLLKEVKLLREQLLVCTDAVGINSCKVTTSG